jgi:hypothetical protein
MEVVCFMGSVGFCQRQIRLWRKSPNECGSSSLHPDLKVGAMNCSNYVTLNLMLQAINLPKALASALNQTSQTDVCSLPSI